MPMIIADFENDDKKMKSCLKKIRDDFQKIVDNPEKEDHFKAVEIRQELISRTVTILLNLKSTRSFLLRTFNYYVIGLIELIAHHHETLDGLDANKTFLKSAFEDIFSLNTKRLSDEQPPS